MMQPILTVLRSIAIAGIGFAAGIAQAGANSPAIHLDAPVGVIKASGTSLADVIDQLQTNSGNQILLNRAALRQAHITPELPVTIDLSNLPLNKALDQLLDAVGGSHVKLAYTVDNGVIEITTAAELSKNVMTQVYDIQPALKNDASSKAAIAAIIRQIRGIDPLSWADSGAGGEGTTDEYQGELIITQTPELQARIAAEIKIKGIVGTPVGN